jgi:hypothetical protein
MGGSLALVNTLSSVSQDFSKTVNYLARQRIPPIGSVVRLWRAVVDFGQAGVNCYSYHRYYV